MARDGGLREAAELGQRDLCRGLTQRIGGGCPARAEHDSDVVGRLAGQQGQVGRAGLGGGVRIRAQHVITVIAVTAVITAAG